MTRKPGITAAQDGSCAVDWPMPLRPALQAAGVVFASAGGCYSPQRGLISLRSAVAPVPRSVRRWECRVPPPTHRPLRWQVCKMNAAEKQSTGFPACGLENTLMIRSEHTESALGSESWRRLNNRLLLALCGNGMSFQLAQHSSSELFFKLKHVLKHQLEYHIWFADSLRGLRGPTRLKALSCRI
jgi:hypothetical protein